MAERPSTQFYLADLVMVVLLCGLGAALVIAVRTPGDAALRLLLLVIVMVSWSVFRAHRRAPTCEECGRRFVRPKQKAVPGSCPHCGREPIARARLLRLVSTIFWGLTAVLVLFGLMPATVPRFGLGPHDAIAMTGGLIAFCGLNLAVLAITGISIYRSVLTWPRERTCEGCGGTIPVEPPAGPSICPACRVRHLRPGEAKKEQAKNAGVLVLFLGAVTFIAMSLLRLGTGSGSGMSGWIRFPLVFLAMSAGAFGGAGRVSDPAPNAATPANPEPSQRTLHGQNVCRPGRRGRETGQLVNLVFRRGRSDTDASRTDGRGAAAVRNAHGRSGSCPTVGAHPRLSRSRRFPAVPSSDLSRRRFLEFRRSIPRASLSVVHALHGASDRSHHRT